MEQLVTIKLFGQPYTFKANSEVRQAKEVADFLVAEVSRVEDQQSGKSTNISKIAILMLAALNIANENIELKEQYSKLLQDISKRSTDLIQKLDNSV